MDKFDSRRHVASKVDWEGGIFDALDYGIKAADMPEGDGELTAAWTALDAAWAVVKTAATAVEDLLPEPGDEDAEVPA